MSTLYPPIIEGKLPAQVGTDIIIPFKHNRAGHGEAEGLALQIKTMGTGTVKATLYSEGFEGVFQLDKDNILLPGQFYKAQLAYWRFEVTPSLELIQKPDYWSTVGIFKYTVEPTINLTENGRLLQADYLSSDTTELPYSYIFNIYKDSVLIESSGEQFENIYEIKSELNPYVSYTKECTVITQNMLSRTVSSVLNTSPEVYYEYAHSLSVIANVDTGSNKIFTTKNNSASSDSGYYRLLRRDESGWHEIGKCQLSDLSQFTYIDYSIQPGVYYKYAIQKYYDWKNETGIVYAQKLESNEVVNYYEDMYLSDATRNVNIRFNPKVSSFKTTILEQKTDTIGSKFPFFSRNGKTSYKEFSINGLISRLADYNEDEIIRQQTPSQAIDTNFTTNLTADNIQSELEYKLGLLDWLNNGQPKLFRSPTEGAYIVRLMNVSLTPEERLGRMLHSFSATAYECVELNFDNLQKNKIIASFPEFDLPQRIESVEVSTNTSKTNIKTTYLRALNMFGGKIYITYQSGKKISYNTGYTGTYILNIDNTDPVVGFTVNSVGNENSNITFTPRIEYLADYNDSDSKLKAKSYTFKLTNTFTSNVPTTYLRFYREPNNVGTQISIDLDEETYILGANQTELSIVNDTMVKYNRYNAPSSVNIIQGYWEEEVNEQ